jgi:hypothetical protein
MSIKIYNGKQLGNMTIQELHHWQKGLRKVFTEKSNELFSLELATVITDLLNYASMHSEYELTEYLKKKYVKGDLAPTFSVSSVSFWGTYRLSKEAMKQDVCDSNDHLDYRAKLVIFPLQHKLLALLLSEVTEFHTIFNSYNRVCNYGYGNSGYKPETVSQKEWLRRKSDWQIAFNNYKGGAFDNGIIYDLVADTPLVRPLDVLHLIQSFADRSGYLAFDRLHSRLIKAEYKQTPTDEFGDDGISHWSTIARATKEFISTSEGQAMLATEKLYVGSYIPEVIDLNTIKRDLSSFCIPVEWSDWSI